MFLALASPSDDGQECPGDRASRGAASASASPWSADIPPLDDGTFISWYAWNETLSGAVYV